MSTRFQHWVTDTPVVKSGLMLILGGVYDHPDDHPLVVLASLCCGMAGLHSAAGLSHGPARRRSRPLDLTQAFELNRH